MKRVFIKLFITINLFIIMAFSSFIKVKANTIEINDNEYRLLDSINYNDGTQFKGLWVSSFAGDISSYSTEEAFKKEMITLLDIMEYYHLNALIFHVRTHNNALYNSSINPKASYWTRVNFDVFDPLEWLIDETHKRGIEFHAWMNPYRVKSSNRTYISGSFPKVNPASDPDNLLSNSSTTILDPGKEVVKSFLVSTCIEFVNRYDVDAIHFDDYFYISDCDDSKTYNENNPNGLSKADWRRNNVDDFIRRLSNQLKRYNENNNKCVQLGIAPGGTWKNGDGKVTYDSDGTAITTGSIGSGGSSYGDSLYADSKKWVDNEWIDYICPQCYHDIKNGNFCELTEWWDKVCKYKKTNLYIGMGYYGPGSHWQDPNELKNQLDWLSGLENVKGFSLYAYSALKKAYYKTNELKKIQMELAYEDYFNNISLLPVVRRYQNETINEINNIVLIKEDNYKLIFDYNESVKFYVIYKDEVENENIIYLGKGVINQEEKTEIEIKENEFNKLIIAPISRNNVVCDKVEIDKLDLSYKIIFVYDEIIIKEIYTKEKTIDIPVFDFDYDNYKVILSNDLTNIDSNLLVNIVLEEKEKYVFVTYISEGKEETKEFLLTKDFPNDVLKLLPKVDGKEIVGLTKVSENNYFVEYLDIKYKIKFFDFYDNLIKEDELLYGSEIIYPTLDEIDGYYFVDWDYKKLVEKDIDIHAIYQEYLKINLIDYNNQLVGVFEFKDGELVDLKELIDIEDGKKVKFYIGDKECSEQFEITSDLVIKYELTKKNNGGCNSNSIVDINYLIASLSLCLLVFIFRKRESL